MDLTKINDKIIDSMENLLNVTSDFTRLKILLCLFNEDKCENNLECERCSSLNCSVERCVNEIVELVGASQSLISHQLKILKQNKIVNARREGKRVFYSLADGHIKLLLKVVYEHVMEDIYDTESL